MVGGEIYVKKIPSMRVEDIASAISPGAMHKYVGIRPGEKIHEVMISSEDSRSTIELEKYYIIKPESEELRDRVLIKGNSYSNQGLWKNNRTGVVRGHTGYSFGKGKGGMATTNIKFDDEINLFVFFKNSCY
jgi:FlaA1/EpsC-like NDP-sugar epimerase